MFKEKCGRETLYGSRETLTLKLTLPLHPTSCVGSEVTLPLELDLDRDRIFLNKSPVVFD